MVGCLILTAPLEVFGDGVYRQARRTAAAVIPVALVFIVWDLIAIAGDVWTYNPRFVSGIDIGIMPLEELMFFIVIPLCGLLTYSAVSYLLCWVSRRKADREVSR